MRRGQWADDPERLWGLSTDGVIKTAILRRLGIAGATISYRCREGGPWQRLLPGVVLLHSGRPSQRQRLVAAQTYGGAVAMLSGHAALGGHGYSRSASMAEVLLLIPDEHHRHPTGFVTVERTTRMPEAVVRAGLRLAPIERAVLDAARRMGNLRSCQALLTEVVQRGDADVVDLIAELEAGSSRGSAVPRKVLRELTSDAHSVAEIEAQKLYAATGLPPMVHNCDIVDADGRFIARPDGWIDEVAMAWEIDSLAHHLSADDHERTEEKRELMQSHGIIVVSHAPRRMRKAPKLVQHQLRAGYRLACARPRPDVHIR